MKQNRVNETANESAISEVSGITNDNVLDFSSTLRELKRSVDPNLIRQRAAHRDRSGQVHMVDYVEWHTVADILDESAPNWCHTVKDIRAIGDIATITVAITIDGVTREGIGTGHANSETGIKKAEHDALKRAAVKFGIARELYKREFDSIAVAEIEGHSGSNELAELCDPVAKSLGDMVTAKQLGMIKAIARENGLIADDECRDYLGCSVDELSKRAASDLIEHLQGLRHNSGSSAASQMRRAG